MSQVRVWFSSEEGTPMPDGSLNAAGARYALSPQPDIALQAIDEPAVTTIRIDPSRPRQSMLGLGCSFDEATVYNLRRMPEGDRVLRALVDPVEGIGWNLMRICFGSSDFTARPYYSYDDAPPGQTDINLDRFSIEKDIEYGIVDTIQKALACNPALKLFASPWSPPGWMKSTGKMGGGRLRPEYYAVAARYYRMAVQAYRAEGIPLHAFTLQNEPLMVHRKYPTCRFTWQEQLAFLLHVRREFDAHHLDTAIWIFDHNFNQAMRYPAKILADPEGYAAADGIAFHAYEGRVEQMGELHAAFPEKPLYFTEYSTWRAGGIAKVLSYFRNGAQSYNAWVACLDDRRQPNAGPHGASPTFVTVRHDDPAQWWLIPEYYLLGQVSKFIQRGARRFESEGGGPDTVTHAAFLNPDGTWALVAVNQSEDAQPFRVLVQGWQFALTLPPKTVGTCTWKETML